MKRFSIAYFGPLLVLALAGSAIAQDAAGLPLPSQPDPIGGSANYLMQLGPYGALAWGAWVLRGLMDAVKGGLNFNVTHKHEFTADGVEALEKLLEQMRAKK